MIDGMTPAEFRRRWLSQVGKVSLLPNERRYNSDGAYAFKIDSGHEVGFASFVVCKLVDELVLTLEKEESVETKALDRWHLDYAKAGFRSAGMADIASALEQDPLIALEAITRFLSVNPAPPMVFVRPPAFARGH
jgi:hypothetical protein